MQLNEKTCKLCGGRFYARDLCKNHYQKAKRSKEFMVKRSGYKHSSPRIYRGPGFSITKNGYRKIRLGSGRWILEHRWVMEQRLCRPLESFENVHHKDGNRLNNKRSNLELWVKRQPSGQRVRDLLQWARWIIKRYE